MIILYLFLGFVAGWLAGSFASSCWYNDKFMAYLEDLRTETEYRPEERPIIGTGIEAPRVEHLKVHRPVAKHV